MRVCVCVGAATAQHRQSLRAGGSFSQGDQGPAPARKHTGPLPLPAEPWPQAQPLTTLTTKCRVTCRALPVPTSCPLLMLQGTPQLAWARTVHPSPPTHYPQTGTSHLSATLFTQWLLLITQVSARRTPPQTDLLGQSDSCSHTPSLSSPHRGWLYETGNAPSESSHLSPI